MMLIMYGFNISLFKLFYNFVSVLLFLLERIYELYIYEKFFLVLDLWFFNWSVFFILNFL